MSVTSEHAPTRRQILRAGAGGTGLAIAGSLLPDSLHRAMAAPMRPGGLRAVEHVVLLMQENRAFDHYLGSLRGVRGYGDRNPLPRRTGGTVFEQPAAGGAPVLPYSVRQAAAAAGRAPTDIQYLAGLAHGWPDATQAWNDGWWDAWVPAKTESTMTYYDRRDIPLQYELAETFTSLDAYHCSVFGSTNPNRNYFFTGTTGYEADGRRAVGNDAYGYDHPGYDWPTYPERLESAGVSWQIYQEWDNFTDNPVEYFKVFKAIGHKMLAHVDGTWRTTEELYDALGGKPTAEQDRLLAQLEQGRAALTPAERSLFDRGMYRSRPGTLVQRIRDDIAAGRLPTVTWVVPSAVLSEHPSASTPVGSAGLVHDLLDVVASDLDTWRRSAILLNFDENDGFFDHVPPPLSPRPVSGNDDDWWLGRPVGPGPRVPMTIVSPWSIGGWVDSSPADHTSTLQFLELVTGVREPNISSWRRDNLADLTGAFDWDRAGRPPRTRQPDPIPAPIDRWHPTPPVDQTMPQQEPGRRLARPLAFGPAVSATWRSGALRISIGNRGSGTAPFTVYSLATGGPPPQYLSVGGRSSRTHETAAATAWNVLVQGPNRFWATVAGSVAGAARDVDVLCDPGRGSARLRVRLANGGRTPVRLTLVPHAFGGRRTSLTLPPGRSHDIEWPTRGGWYDLEVLSPDDGTFRRRVTGRLEDARAGRTAP